MTSLIFGQGLGAGEDYKHYQSDWESNIDGHLFFATDKYFANGKQDTLGFKEYMRQVFQRPFIQQHQLAIWFDKLEEKKTDKDLVRVQALRDLRSELRI